MIKFIRQSAKYLKLAASVAVCLSIVLTYEAVYAQMFKVDQSYTPSSCCGWYNIDYYSPVGQEFTPTFSALDTVELNTNYLAPIDADEGNLFVNIRYDTIDGTIVGTSSTAALQGGYSGVTHFDFSTPVSLVPDSRYIIEVVVASGLSGGLMIGRTSGDGYSGGRSIFQGTPGYQDLWFSEGLTIVPEPISSILFVTGGTLLAGRRFYKRARS